MDFFCTMSLGLKLAMHLSAVKHDLRQCKSSHHESIRESMQSISNAGPMPLVLVLALPAILLT